MKQFMITFKNLGNGLELDTAFNANNMSEALFDAERLCNAFKKHDVILKVTLIYEMDENK